MTIKALSSSSERWARSPDGIVAGICEGLGQRFDVPPNLIRLVWILSLFVAGSGFLLYLALWWILPVHGRLPVEPTIWRRERSGLCPPLTRTQVDKKILGVCGGLARRWGVDPSLVRLAALSIAALSFGLAVLAYLAFALMIPASEQPARPVDIEL